MRRCGNETGNNPGTGAERRAAPEAGRLAPSDLPPDPVVNQWIALCAEAAGFRSGDRILSFNGEEISSASDLTQALQNCQVGDTVEIIIVRDGQKYSGSLTLEESKPASAN